MHLSLRRNSMLFRKTPGTARATSKSSNFRTLELPLHYKTSPSRSSLPKFNAQLESLVANFFVPLAWEALADIGRTDGAALGAHWPKMRSVYASSNPRNVALLTLARTPSRMESDFAFQDSGFEGYSCSLLTSGCMARPNARPTTEIHSAHLLLQSRDNLPYRYTR